MTDGGTGAQMPGAGQTPQAPPTPPAATLPVAQMQEILTALKRAEDAAQRAHALHWLVFQEFQQHPLMWQFTWQEAWSDHAKTALVGLLEMAIQERRTTPDVLLGIAGAMANMFGAHEAGLRTWNRFLQAVPAARQEPMVQNFVQAFQPVVQLHQTLSRPAAQVHRAIMQAVPAPMGMWA